MRVSTGVRLVYIASALAMLICLVYMATPRLMPYHEEYIGMATEALPDKVATLLLLFLKMGAAFGFLMQIAVMLLAKGPLSRGERQAWWLVLLLGLVPLVLLVAVSLFIGWHTPWWAATLVCLLMGAGLLGTRNPESPAA